MASQTERHDPANLDISERRAKQAVAPGHIRYVLGVSMLLAVIAGVFIYLSIFH